MNLIISNWSDTTYNQFLNYLNDIKDVDYKKFQLKLIPNYPPEKLIGIRIPILRKLAKEIYKGDYIGFLEKSKNYYYEEIILKAILIGMIPIKCADDLCELIDLYSPLVDNWATCDIFCSSLKQVNKFKIEILQKIESYLKSDNIWFVRIALVLLLSYYLDDNFISFSLKLAESVKSDSYYVSMAQAWLVATAFAKNEKITMEFFKKCSLDDITFNRTIQKAKESLRLSKELKSELSKMKRTLDKHNA